MYMYVHLIYIVVCYWNLYFSTQVWEVMAVVHGVINSHACAQVILVGRCVCVCLSVCVQ